METRVLADSGIRVSVLGLGTMTWGRDTDEFEAREQYEAFLEAGGNLLAVGNRDGDGLAAEVLGGILEQAERDRIVLSVRSQLPAPTPSSLLAALRSTLTASGQEQADLWLVERPLPELGLAQLADTLSRAMESGLTQFVGVTNLPAWQLAALKALLDRPHRLVAGEYEYSLLVRGVEREVLPAMTGLGIGLLAWSPLGRGVLTGKYRFNIPADSRAGSPHWGAFAKQLLTDRNRQIVQAVTTSAEGLGLDPAEVALAWLLARPGVVSALTGARTAAQLRAILGATEIRLPIQISAALDEVATPGMGYPDAGANPAFRG